MALFNLLTGQWKVETFTTANGDAQATLPTAKASNAGTLRTYKKLDDTLNALRVFAAPGELIDGSDAVIVYEPFAFVTFASDGGQWFVVGKC